LDKATFIVKRLNIHGFWMFTDEYLPKIRAALTDAAKVVASGKLTLPFNGNIQTVSNQRSSRTRQAWQARFYLISITQTRSNRKKLNMKTPPNEHCLLSWNLGRWLMLLAK